MPDAYGWCPANGITATTQAPGDTSTKLATDAFVAAAIAAAVGAYLPLAGGTMTGTINMNENNIVWENPSLGIDAGLSRIFAGVLAVGNGVQGDASGTLEAALVNVSTGFQISGAAASGHYLRGNGTDYVDSVIQNADLPIIGGGILTSSDIWGSVSSKRQCGCNSQQDRSLSISFGEGADDKYHCF